jgi:hypothetical protein
MTEKQRNASRVNGALSQGPATEEGKRRSSLNSWKHGLRSDATNSVVLANETGEGFDKLLEALTAEFKPANSSEELLVEDMASARWRLWRVWMIEKEKLNETVDARMEEHEPQRTANAYWELAGGPQMTLLNRYETKLVRDYHRAMDKLLKLQDRRSVNGGEAVEAGPEQCYTISEDAEVEEAQMELFPEAA